MPVLPAPCPLRACAGLKKFLKKHAEGDTLAVLDAKLGSVIKEKLGINCLYSAGVMELTRGIRNQLTNLVAGLSAQDLRPMSLGLSHSLSRYKLKFSPDKVDTMIVQVRRAAEQTWLAGREGGQGQGQGAGSAARSQPWGSGSVVAVQHGGCTRSGCLPGILPPPAPHPPPPHRSLLPSCLPARSRRPSGCWTSWTRSSTRTPCACASGTAGTSPR